MTLPQIPVRSNMDISQDFSNRAIGVRKSMRHGITTKTEAPPGRHWAGRLAPVREVLLLVDK